MGNQCGMCETQDNSASIMGQNSNMARQKGLASVFHKIGGKAKIYETIEKLYERILADPRINFFFKNVDVDRLKEKEKKFLMLMCDGPNEYEEGKNMKKAHDGWGIKNEHFDITKEHLENTLKDIEIKEEIQYEILENFENLREFVLGKASYFERLGGEKGIDNIIDLFYFKNSSNMILAPYYSALKIKDPVMTLKELKQEEKNYFMSCFLPSSAEENLGSGSKVKSPRSGDVVAPVRKSTPAARKPPSEMLGLNAKAFEIMKKNLESSMLELGYSRALTVEVIIQYEENRAGLITDRSNLYNRLCGKHMMGNIAEKFYKKLRADPRLETVFYVPNPEEQDKDSDQKISLEMERYKRFLTFIFGGTNEYKGGKLHHFFKKFTSQQYTTAKGHLEITLLEFKYDRNLIDDVLVLFESLREGAVHKQSLYSRIGGKDIINQAVDRYIKKQMNDKRFEKRIKKADLGEMMDIVDLERRCIYFLFGGPKDIFSAEDKIHMESKKTLTDQLFDLLKQYFDESFAEIGIPRFLVIEASMMFESQRSHLVKKSCLLERIGGKGVISNCIETYYEMQLADEDVENFYKYAGDVNMIKEVELKYWIKVTGGLLDYQGKTVKQAHCGWKIKDNIFDRCKVYFSKAFEENGVSKECIEELLILYECFRPDVVEKK
jgi:hemoglobin